MTRSEEGTLEAFNPEIERTLRNRQREQREVESQESTTVEMEQEQRTMMDYARPSRDGTNSCITRPNVAMNNFKIKPAIIQMIQQTVQFGRLSHEDLNAYIASFL